MPACWLVLFGTLFILVSLPSFHVGQADRAGGLGWWGTTVLSVGIGMANLPLAILGVADRHALDDDTAYHASSGGTIQFSGIVLIGVDARLRPALGAVRLAVRPGALAGSGGRRRRDPPDPRRLEIDAGTVDRRG